MPRIAKPWYNKEKKAWYATVNGKPRVRLWKGKDTETDRRHATREFERLKRVLPLKVTATQNYDARPCAEVLELFLDYSEKNHARTTYDGYRRDLKLLYLGYGHVRCRDLTSEHAEKIIARERSKPERRIRREYTDREGKPRIVKSGKRKGERRQQVMVVRPWGENKCSNFVSSLSACFGWATRQKPPLVTGNPFANMTAYAPVETRETLISEETIERLVCAADDNFRDFLNALRWTGCRPGEVAGITAANVDLENSMWIIENHKTRHITKRLRRVFLIPDMAEITRRLAELHSEGPLFLNHQGRAYTRNMIANKLNRLCRRLGIDEPVYAYAFRHTYITNALRAGVPAATVAELVGHADVKMIQRRYGHLAQHGDYMREAAMRAVRRPSESDGWDRECSPQRGEGSSATARE